MLEIKAGVLAALSSLGLYGQWITGYYSSGNAVEPVSAIPWSKYTHIVLFAGGPCAVNDGTVCMGHLTQSDINAFIASRPSGKKALVSLGDQCAGLNGCGDSSSWVVDTDPGSVGTFAQNIANFVNSNGFDGVDFDWEGIGTNWTVPVSQYVNLISAVRVLLPGKIIIIAAGPWGGMDTVANAAQSYLDQVNILCYDQDQVGTSWYNAAIYPSSFGGGCASRIAEMTSAGLARAKVGVGVPFYGRRWTGCTQITQTCTQSSTFSYAELVTDTTRWQPQHRFYDTIYKSNYLSIPNSGPSRSEFDSYNGVEFMADVTAWGASNKFGGFITFALEYEYLSNQTGDARYPLSTSLYRAVFGTTPSKPYGSFDSPTDNMTGIAGAIPVTGWALDNIEVVKVDIWRERVGYEPVASNGLVYIGDAVFVAGARPDVEKAYPNVPFSYRAGWGYLMLTNGLPNNGGSPGPGNGTYRLHAIAHNRAGIATDLGTRTIVVDNAHATKPFGTIDTPGQGATVSGTVINFGWVLTQQPYVIPTDGSTIWVTVDGQVVGHPVYNQYRSDIATSFPAYVNSNGAVGYFYLDTTILTNGVHNIGWLVYDNAGRGDGIGSRFFTVANSGSGAAAAMKVTASARAPEGVKLRRGHELHREPEPLAPDRDGTLSVELEELGRIELQVGATAGYLVLNGERRPLPIGSSLKAGVFYWQLGPGFLGDFDLVFLRNESGGSAHEIPARVHVRSKN